MYIGTWVCSEYSSTGLVHIIPQRYRTVERILSTFIPALPTPRLPPIHIPRHTYILHTIYYYYYYSTSIIVWNPILQRLSVGYCIFLLRPPPPPPLPLFSSRLQARTLPYLTLPYLTYVILPFSPPPPSSPSPSPLPPHPPFIPSAAKGCQIVFPNVFHRDNFGARRNGVPLGH